MFQPLSLKVIQIIFMLILNILKLKTEKDFGNNNLSE